MGRHRRLPLLQLIEGGQTALLVIDNDRAIRMVNPGIQRLIGWTAEDLEDVRCDRGAPSTAVPIDTVATALAPPAECWAGQVMTQMTVLPHRSGAICRLTVTFVPLQQSDGLTAAVLIVLTEPTDQPRFPGAGADLGHGSAGDASAGRHLHAEISALRLDLRRRFRQDSFIGRCPEILRALRQAEVVGDTRCSFALIGPEGSGRRHLARLIHGRSSRSAGSFAALNCHLLTSAMLLTTIHQLRTDSESDAGTAPHRQTGLLLLCGIERLAQEVQLWFLQHGRLDDGALWLGATSDQSLTVLEKSGNLLPELAARLTTMEIHLPPLHDRGDDVLLLVQQFIEENRRDHRTAAERAAGDVASELRTYRWPGQVRELKAMIASACQQCRTAEIQTADLPFGFRVGRDAQRYPVLPESATVSLENLLQHFERDVIHAALRGCRDNKAEAARRLGLTRPKLYRRMQALGLETDVDET